ncbi:NCS2 family permease [Peribacillus simplex]|jgi:AGZA family xanthine/uracil permease-like MFS transporter|uniref:NCS2 family permease n=1 Tax=Peribacillus simplex TaxID=1478 RepID=A0AAW7ICG1_9BACI|nr:MULTISPECIES: NCS2 family permease [Peribacillus]AMM95246.1 guanine permease [Peribacillus simplex]MDF9758687.1 AGZA family xanthine/uracil permease-like MFS transporter [Peribacillus simplex]MDM5292311.1 NCS2 family permease [Peribacillus simplex]MDM5451239.1 NCS2 family permease [Peribacillus simplex]MDV7765549.1 NCS2 family permease [Peribacillus sp. CSMR9]
MFKLKERNSNIKTEVLAGLTTFLTLAYIIVVNPMILSDAGVPFDQAFTATIIAIIVGTLCMALLANYPIIIAPAMGLNAYFAYSVLGTHDISYTVAFSAVFVTGIIFILLSLTSFRSKLIEAIPNNLKHAISAGIGLFITFIGLRLSGVVTQHESNLVTLGSFRDPSVALTLVGLVITIVLIVRNVQGAIFIGMIVTAIIAFFTGQLEVDGLVSTPTLPEGIIVANPITSIADVINYGLYGVVFSILLVMLFDTTGALLGIVRQAGLLKNNKLEKSGSAFFADSIGTTVGAMFGTSPTAASVESSAGVGAGGKTGLTALVVAILFLITAFFSPLIGAVSNVAAITAPSLIIVGSMMIKSINEIDWTHFDESFPAFLVIVAMPLTSSIANGIALGFIAYPILKMARGKFREVHPFVYVFAILFLYQLIFLA